MTDVTIRDLKNLAEEIPTKSFFKDFLQLRITNTQPYGTKTLCATYTFDMIITVNDKPKQTFIKCDLLLNEHDISKGFTVALYKATNLDEDIRESINKILSSIRSPTNHITAITFMRSPQPCYRP